MVNKLILVSMLVGLLSCQPDDKLTGVAAGAAGRYIVTAYIESGDTLFSVLPGSSGYTSTINRIGVSNFTVELTATGSDQLVMKTTYWQNGIQTTVGKEIKVQLTNYDYQFSLLKTNNPFTFYEGSVGRFSGLFYEHMVGSGFRIAPPNASPSPASSSQDIVILAQPGR